MRRRSGFTLKELLIVVATIMLLVGIMLPSLSNVKRIAQRTQCMANIRQLQYSFQAYTNMNYGKAMGTVVSGCEFWAPAMTPFSSKTDLTQRLLLSVYCPAATTPSNGVGTASLAWGPNYTYNDIYCSTPHKLPLGKQSGSYGINGWLFNNNREPGVAVECGSVDMNGTPCTVEGDVISLGAVSLKGHANITGTLYTPPGTSVSLNGGNTVTQVAQPGLSLPDVRSIYNNLLPSALTPTGNTIDFTKGGYYVVPGSANLNNYNYVGNGTILSPGNVSVPSKNLTLNIVALGSVDGNDIDGSVYCVGDYSNQGAGGTVTGIVVTMGTFHQGGHGDIKGGPPPAFDTYTGMRGFLSPVQPLVLGNPARVPVFGDAIWPEAWPNANDQMKTSLQKTGDITSQLGRFNIDRYNGAINIVFLDGHGEVVRLGELRNLTWSLTNGP